MPKMPYVAFLLQIIKLSPTASASFEQNERGKSEGV
jgi:hypothetical protein